MKRKSTRLEKLTTEQPNRASTDLDLKTGVEIARIINSEDAKVAAAIAQSLPQIGRAIDLIAAQMRKGGRLIYVGTGTSGRVGALDASECAPTFGIDPSRVQFMIAGGTKALAVAVEASEDSRDLGRSDMAKRKPGKNDVIVGVAASGRTPYTIAALEHARACGAQTIAVTCNHDSQLERAAHFGIVTEVGPEVLAGSSRMKAGSAQKMVLNMLSTGAMAKMGYIYGNLMVNLHLKNVKLAARGISIVQWAAGMDREAAQSALKAAENDVPIALVMLKAGVTRAQAAKALKTTSGHVRRAITLARKKIRT